MTIKDILAKGRPTLSFEVFPPKSEDKYETVEMAAGEIAKLRPDFMQTKIVIACKAIRVFYTILRTGCDYDQEKMRDDIRRSVCTAV